MNCSGILGLLVGKCGRGPILEECRVASVALVPDASSVASRCEVFLTFLNNNPQILDTMKTRGQGNTKTAAEATEAAKTITPKIQLDPEAANPPQVFILPKDISPEARIVTLQNPRYQSDSRYFVCPTKGFYEFSKISAPRLTPRSWLLSSAVSADGQPLEKDTDSQNIHEEGYVTKDANLFIATAIDPLFLILPALCPNLPKVSNAKKLFLSGEDYFDSMTSKSPHLASFVRTDSINTLLQSRMAAVSDTVDAGDETMYRLNDDKLLNKILSKARKMVKNGLPGSMEEKLVRKALEQPTSITGIPQEDNNTQDEESAPVSGTETPDTQTTTITAGSFSEASTAATSFSESMGVVAPKSRTLPPIVAPDGVAELLRLRTAFLYICSAYISPHLTEILKTLLATSSNVDFTPLEDHLTQLTKLRQEALAARSLGDYSRKRAHDDDENEEKRAEKRRKNEEEKKRKANESRGVKALKKVNVSGMKKMSSFFKPK